MPNIKITYSTIEILYQLKWDIICQVTKFYYQDGTSS